MLLYRGNGGNVLCVSGRFFYLFNLLYLSQLVILARIFIFNNKDILYYSYSYINIKLKR